MKHMCELSKGGVKKNLKEIKKIVINPKCICKECGRVSNNKNRLCEGIKLDLHSKK